MTVYPCNGGIARVTCAAPASAAFHAWNGAVSTLCALQSPRKVQALQRSDVRLHPRYALRAGDRRPLYDLCNARALQRHCKGAKVGRRRAKERT